MNKYSILVCVLLCACYRPYSKLKTEHKSDIIKHIGSFELSKCMDNETDLFDINGQNIKEVQNTLKEKDDRLFIILFNWCTPVLKIVESVLLSKAKL